MCSVKQKLAMDGTMDSETSFISTPEASSTHYMTVVSGLETSVQRLNSSVAAMELAVQQLRKSERRTCLWQILFAVTLLLLLASVGASLWFTLDLRSEIQIMNKVRVGSGLERESNITAKLSMTAGLQSLALEEVVPPKLTTTSASKRRYYVPPKPSK